MSKLSDKFKNFETPQTIKIQDLKPPKPSKPIIDYEGIDFNKIANSSEFKRLIYMIYTGKTHRGTKEALDTELRTHKDNISIVKELGRGSHQDFRGVVNELKEVLAKRKAKIEE